MTTENQAPEGGPALVQRITYYLVGGGLFNPELANHDAIRDLLIECRAALAAQPQSTHPADQSKSTSAIDTSPAEEDALGKALRLLEQAIQWMDTNYERPSAIHDEALAFIAANRTGQPQPKGTAPAGWKFERAGDVIKAIAPDGVYWCVVRDDEAREDKIGAFFWALCDDIAPAPLTSVCHMECDTCIDNGKCAFPGKPAEPAHHPHPDEDDAVTLWAEIHRLRAAVQGPDGYATWQDAATAERVRRVAAEKALAEAQAPAPAQTEGTPVATDRPFFAYDPENGVEFFKTEQEAHAYAAESLKEYSRAASFDGEWSGDVEDVKVGRVTHVAVERGSDEAGFDYSLEPTVPCAAVKDATLVCKTCGVDRYKAACPALGVCPMHSEAQTAAAFNVPVQGSGS